MVWASSSGHAGRSLRALLGRLQSILGSHETILGLLGAISGRLGRILGHLGWLGGLSGPFGKLSWASWTPWAAPGRHRITQGTSGRGGGACRHTRVERGVAHRNCRNPATQHLAFYDASTRLGSTVLQTIADDSHPWRSPAGPIVCYRLLRFPATPSSSYRLLSFAIVCCRR